MLDKSSLTSLISFQLTVNLHSWLNEDVQGIPLMLQLMKLILTKSGNDTYAEKVREKACRTNNKEHKSPEFRLLFHLLFISQSKDLERKESVKQTIDRTYHARIKPYTCKPIRGLHKNLYKYKNFSRRHLRFSSRLDHHCPAC